MEVSSHALDQGRTDGVSFRSAVFTNLTRDHLDYHKTFGNYFRAKAKLFRALGKNAVAVVNRDDPYGRKLAGLVRGRFVTYGLGNGADVYATDIETGRQATSFDLHLPGGPVLPIKVSLIGRHNVYNIMSVAAWAYALGFSRDVIAGTFERFKRVPGRLEKVPGSKEYSVFVDYAHTDDALRNVISTLRQVSARRIIVVFGCGGDRDRTKRPLMGKVATELADFAVITDDNPRSEDPCAIVNDILSGIGKGNYCIVHDRASAIRRGA
jgi:UDP-N-acetylmuramoyl-L-alanyl-D-glutamate--2,6-diaminopimelate ligase